LDEFAVAKLSMSIALHYAHRFLFCRRVSMQIVIDEVKVQAARPKNLGDIRRGRAVRIVTAKQS
jgi:hypothetical protein